MRDTIKGAIIGAFVAAGVSVLLAQAPSWTAPRTWATDDLLTAAQFNAQIRDNFLNMRGFAACAENGTTGTSSALTVLYGDCRWAAAATVTIAALGCTGTANADTVLFGDCRWAEPPAQYAANLSSGSTTTTSTTYVNLGSPSTLVVGSGSDVAIRLMGVLQTSTTAVFGVGCSIRILNTTTSTALAVTSTDANFSTRDFYIGYEVNDTTPAVGSNSYQIQIRRNNAVSCKWSNTAVSTYSARGVRGLIAFLS